MNVSKQTIIYALVATIVAGGLAGAGMGYITVQESIKQTLVGSGSTVIQQPEVIKEKSYTSDVIEVAKKASASVVSVIVTKELTRYKQTPQNLFFFDPFSGDPFSPFSNVPQQNSQPQVEKERRQVAGGTGFIVTTEGRIVTNKHVVSDPDADYTVVLGNGEEYPASVVSRDPSNDLAVLQIEKNDDGNFPSNLQALPLADKNSIQVGQTVIAIGDALGEFDNSVTMGVVSAKGRSIVASDGGSGSEQLSNLLQTDAAINPGNSGGPLLSLDGEVIGINTAIAESANGIGFAIPSDEVDFVLRSIQKYGTITRPFLGVAYKQNTPEIAKQFNLSVDYGAILQMDVQGEDPSIIKDGPAAKAGLKGGDIILKVNGEKVTQDHSLQELIRTFLPDDSVTLTILRDGKEQDIKVTLGKRTDDTVAKSGNDNQNSDTSSSLAFLGVNSITLTQDIATGLNISTSQGALLYNDFGKGVPAIVKDSPADKAGLQAGDIIISLNGTTLDNNDNTLQKLIAKQKPGDEITVTIMRGSEKKDIKVTLGTREVSNVQAN